MEKYKVILYARGNLVTRTKKLPAWSEQIYRIHKVYEEEYEIVKCFVDQFDDSKRMGEFYKMLRYIKKSGDVFAVCAYRKEVIKNYQININKIIKAGAFFFTLK